MRLVADAGLWRTGSGTEATPLVAVLEVSGAVLSWTVDDPSRVVDITFTDVTRADWLWRVLGAAGHATLSDALDGRDPAASDAVDVTGVDVAAGSLEAIRRLALGHWLRRWWPASHRDGIAVLDAALLDAEIAVLTAAADEFFTDDTVDSDIAELIRPHTEALAAHARLGDPRITTLVDKCADLADDVGVDFGEAGSHAPSGGRRDDYALAAGAEPTSSRDGVIATGRSSIDWGGVPPGVFDAAEDTVAWSVQARDDAVEYVVQTELSGLHSPAGVPARVRTGPIGGEGVLGADGRARLRAADAEQRPITVSAAWDNDWRSTVVTVGADVDESVMTRDRVRAFARSRLSDPGDDAFLAEIVAAESDY